MITAYISFSVFVRQNIEKCEKRSIIIYNVGATIGRLLTKLHNKKPDCKTQPGFYYCLSVLQIGICQSDMCLIRCKSPLHSASMFLKILSAFGPISSPFQILIFLTVRPIGICRYLYSFGTSI